MPEDDYIEIPEIDEEPTPQPEHAPSGLEDAFDTERIKEIQRLAASGELEGPSGADEIVEALKIAVLDRDDLFGKMQRMAADHQNFQRRAHLNEVEAKEQAIRGVLQSIIPVLDHFELALGQDPEKLTTEAILGGVRMIQTEFLRVLSNCGVSQISPEPNEEFNPMRHEAMMRQPAEGIEPGHVAQCLGVGYALGDRVVRPAKVAITPSEG
ncbi:MAG: molecular chaperone GrpE [Phycisphaerales bacterium]|jgi:molecular chaperone GrpE